jgi:hypothetical protein
MSTAMKTEPTHRTVEERIHGAIAMSPTSGRAIVVEVYLGKDRHSHSVHWMPVLAFCSVIQARYGKRMYAGDHHHPRVAADHAGMTEAGWTCDEASEVEVWPVVEDCEYGLHAADGRLDCSNMVRRVVVACDWPVEQDREHAVRIGQAIVAGGCEQGGWADLESPVQD